MANSIELLAVAIADDNRTEVVMHNPLDLNQNTQDEDVKQAKRCMVSPGLGVSKGGNIQGGSRRVCAGQGKTWKQSRAHSPRSHSPAQEEIKDSRPESQRSSTNLQVPARASLSKLFHNSRFSLSQAICHDNSEAASSNSYTSQDESEDSDGSESRNQKGNAPPAPPVPLAHGQNNQTAKTLRGERGEACSGLLQKPPDPSAIHALPRRREDDLKEGKKRIKENRLAGRRQKARRGNEGDNRYVSYLGLLNGASNETEYYRLYKDCEMELNSLCHEKIRESVLNPFTIGN